MIKYIQDNILYVDDSPNWGETIDKDYVDYILSIIEGAGMMPPVLTKKVANDNGFYISPYHWEPESE